MLKLPINKRNSVIRKALAGFLAGAFLFTNTLGWAQEERLFSTAIENTASSSGPDHDSKLAPRLLLTDAERRAVFQASLICELVEERARYGKPIEEIGLGDLSLWKNATDGEFECFSLKLLPHKLII